jgi:uncharacterized protein (DUF302 family)
MHLSLVSSGEYSMRTLVLGLVVAAACASQVVADSNLVKIPSRYSVVETMDRLEAAVKASSNDFQIFSRVNFQGLAATRGDKIRPSQLLIFGRGGLLQPLLPEFPTSAIDLPLKVLAWEDDVGKIWVAYTTGELLRERHNIQGRDEFLKRMTEVTASFAKKASE